MRRKTYWWVTKPICSEECRWSTDLKIEGWLFDLTKQARKKRSCLYFWASNSGNVDKMPMESVEQRIPCLQNSKADRLSYRGNAPRLGLNCPCFENTLHDQCRLNFRGIQISQTNLDANVEKHNSSGVSAWVHSGKASSDDGKSNLKNYYELLRCLRLGS